MPAKKIYETLFFLTVSGTEWYGAVPYGGIGFGVKAAMLALYHVMR